MKIYSKDKQDYIAGAVSFDYRDFVISLQNQYGNYANLVIFYSDPDSNKSLGSELPANAEGIRDAMVLIDQYHLNKQLAE